MARPAKFEHAGDQSLAAGRGRRQARRRSKRVRHRGRALRAAAAINLADFDARSARDEGIPR
jgi:hypothetical protein